MNLKPHAGIERKSSTAAENPLVITLWFLSVVVLLLIVQYTRFYINNGKYLPHFLLAWDKSLFQGDLIRTAFFGQANIIMYNLFGYATSIVNHIGAENFLFISSVINGALIIYVCYKTAMLFGSRALAALFAVVLFTPFQLLPGADMTIIYPHHLGPSTFSLLPALLAFYFYLSKKFTLAFASLAITALLHIKTGFAIAVPLALCITWESMDGNINRKDLIRSLLLSVPIFAFTAFYYSNIFANFSSNKELVDAMIAREDDEVDILKTNIFLYHTYNYIFLNLLAIYFKMHYRLNNYIEKRIFKLIIASNIGILIGILVAVIHNYFMPVGSLMLLAWPKIAIVSTYFSIFIICRSIILINSIWEKGNELAAAFICFVALITLQDRFNIKYVALTAIMAISFSMLLRLNFIKHRNAQVSFVSLFILTSIFVIQARLFSTTLKQKIEYRWFDTIYRAPYDFDPYQYQAIKWLNGNTKKEEMIICPGRINTEVQYDDIRGYSKRPLFYTSAIIDAYGSVKQYEEWKRRRKVLDDWFNTKNLEYLTKNKIGYILIRKQDEKFFNLRLNLRVYENKEMIIYSLK